MTFRGCRAYNFKISKTIFFQDLDFFYIKKQKLSCRHIVTHGSADYLGHKQLNYYNTLNNMLC